MDTRPKDGLSLTLLNPIRVAGDKESVTTEACAWNRGICGTKRPMCGQSKSVAQPSGSSDANRVCWAISTAWVLLWTPSLRMIAVT